MVLRFLLDENIPPLIAAALKSRQPMMVVFDIHNWRSGTFLSTDDETLLEAAVQEGLTFVTFDVSTIPEVLSNWAEANRNHYGIVFANSKIFRADRIGEIVAGLEELWLSERSADWTNRIVFLKKQSSYESYSTED